MISTTVAMNADTLIVENIENQKPQRRGGASKPTSSRIRRCDKTSQLGGVLATLSLNENNHDNKSLLQSPLGDKGKHANPYKTPMQAVESSSQREVAGAPLQLDILCGGEHPVLSPLETPSPLARSKSVYSAGSTDHSIVSYSSNTPISNHHSKESTSTERRNVQDDTNKLFTSPESNASSSNSRLSGSSSSSETVSEYTNDLIGVGLQSATSDEEYNDDEDEVSCSDDDDDDEGSDLDDSCFVSEEFVPYGRAIDADTSDVGSQNDNDEDQQSYNTSYDRQPNTSHDDSSCTEIVEAIVVDDHDDDDDDDSLDDWSSVVQVEVVNDDNSFASEKRTNNDKEHTSASNVDKKNSSQGSRELLSKRSFSDFITSSTGSLNKSMIRKGKWTIGSRIGQGSFGVVHVGMNTISGNLIAIKSMNIPTSSSSSSSSNRGCSLLLEDLRREIVLMQSFNHPNIVRYLGCECDEAKQVLHIFQEWISGGSVTSLLSKFGPFPIPVIRSYLHQVLLGLKYLHENKILHRDIKGGNILVNNDGIVKLADFGASKSFHLDQDGAVLDVEDAMSQMTMRGTPYFMAPEVFEEKYGRKADIWSFGCVAYQMLTSNPPWRGLGLQSPMTLFLYISKHQGPPPMNHDTKDINTSHVDCEIDKNHDGALICDDLLFNLLEQCFERDPSNRPSAQSLLEHPFFTQVDLHDSMWEDEEEDEDNAKDKTEFVHVGSVMEQKGKTVTSPLSPFSPLRLADWKRSRVGKSYRSIKENPEWPSWAKPNPDASVN